MIDYPGDGVMMDYINLSVKEVLEHFLQFNPVVRNGLSLDESIFKGHQE